jgi:mRNA-degrading endonuclease toxin of MazEF toxin-antitoxin module
MKQTIAAGQIWMTQFPYKDDHTQGKLRPVVVVAVSPAGYDQDCVVLLVPITGHHDGGLQKKGEVPVLNYRNIPGLAGGDGAWGLARRIWAADPAVLHAQKRPIGTLPSDVMEAVYGEIIALF